MMRGARLYGPGDLRVVDLPVPTPAAGQVLVNVKSYSPYGTDLGVYLNRGGRYVDSYPVGIGADFAGVITSVGEDVTGFSPGDRVTAQSMDNCGACANCEVGRTNLCLEYDSSTFVRQICCDEYVLVSARKLAILPDEVSYDQAATLTGIVDALNAFDKLGVKAGDTVAIIGVGAMGQGAIAAAIGLGLKPVAIGGRGGKADLAERLGAKPVFRIANYGDDIAPRVLADFPRGFAFVLETTASDWGVQQAFAVAAAGASIALTGGGALPATNWDIVDRELRVMGVRGGPDQAKALRLIAEGKIDLMPSINGHFTLENAADTFALLVSDAAKDIGRVIITLGD